MPKRDWESDEIAVAFNATTPIEIRKIALIALTERARLEAENARLQRKAAAWDWVATEDNWLNFDPCAAVGRWTIDHWGTDWPSPLDAVEYAMKEATDAAKT